LEHNDWVRALNVSYDNNYFLSGCVSSVVKLWDLNKKIVIGNVFNQNQNQDFMNTVNSLSFFHSNSHLFMIGLRSGDIKICDSRINLSNDKNQIGVVINFKAHTNKLNTTKINQSDRYILTSGRDSTLRLWDLRKIKEDNLLNNHTNINNDYNRNFINEYNKHKCTGYNVECNFYYFEKYLMTGSETGSIFIYDIFNPNIYKEIKTHLKCVNLVKQIPKNSNAFAFAGLAENAVFIYDSKKNISKFYDKDENNSSDEEKYLIDDDDEIKTDKSQELLNNIIEDIMKEHGDAILKAFHKNNMTYNNGINLGNFLQWVNLIIRIC
jgi:COMPASS component SWD3